MVIGHGMNVMANTFGYKVIGPWRLIPEPIGFPDIGNITEAATDG
jgi:hypothetical protein